VLSILKKSEHVHKPWASANVSEVYTLFRESEVLGILKKSECLNKEWELVEKSLHDFSGLDDDSVSRGGFFRRGPKKVRFRSLHPTSRCEMSRTLKKPI
jgi:hypothetical protein